MARTLAALMVYLVATLFFSTISNGQRKIEPTNPLQRLRTLNDYLPFEVPDDLKSWQRRRTQLQNHLLVSLGLWPLPEKTPLKPVIHGKLVFEDYSVEKVFFQACPGFTLPAIFIARWQRRTVKRN